MAISTSRREQVAHRAQPSLEDPLLRLRALPRLLHLFRALPPAATLEFAAQADAATLEGYEKLLTAKLTTSPQQTQAALPARLGGSGMLRFTELRAQAWLGSWLTTLPRVPRPCPTEGKCQNPRSATRVPTTSRRLVSCSVSA